MSVLLLDHHWGYLSLFFSPHFLWNTSYRAEGVSCRGPWLGAVGPHGQ